MQCILDWMLLVLGIAVMGLALWEGFNWDSWVDENSVSDFPTSEPLFLLCGSGFLISVLSIIKLIKNS